MHRYIRMVDKAQRAYAVECGSAVVDGDVHVHALEPGGEVGQLYRFPYDELQHAGAVYLSHDLRYWLASDERVKPDNKLGKPRRHKKPQAVPLSDAVFMTQSTDAE